MSRIPPGGDIKAKWGKITGDIATQADLQTTLDNLVLDVGSGDVVGPSSSSDGQLTVYNGATGKLLKVSTVTGLLKATTGVPSKVTMTKGDLVVASDTDAPGTVSAVAAGQVLISQGTGTVPAWNANPPVNSVNAADNLTVGVASNTVGKLQMKNATNNNIVTVKPGASTSSFSLTLPTNVPSSNDYLLKVSTSGEMAYTDPSTIGGGSGDLIGPDESVDGQIFVADGVTGKLAKVSTITGILKGGTDGVLVQASAGTDYLTPTGVGSGLTGLTATQVGLGNVDDTSDEDKPVSTATQTALNLKANLANPTFTGTVGGITKGMVGLGSVDNTADTAKPISTTQQSALDLKADLVGGKVPSSQLPSSVGGGFTYKGLLDASGGTYPESPETGDYYVISVAGTISGTAYLVGDWAAFNGISWDKIDNQNLVSSVNTKQGAVVLSTADIADSTDKRYVTDAQKTVIGNTSGTNTGDQDLSSLAPKADPTFTGTVVGVTATMVGLGNVTNDLQCKASEKAAASGIATLNEFSKVEQDPANATATPTASKIPIADGSGKLDGWLSAPIPSQTGNNGKFLTTNGSAASWGTPLPNVTNNAQVKKISSSVDGNFMTWSGTTGDTPADSGIAPGDKMNSIGSATDNAITRFDGTGGATIQNSLVTIDDSGSVNIPTGQTYKINNVALAKGDVGLSNVTNDAQVKKISSSVNGNVMIWSGTTGDTPADSGVGVSAISLPDQTGNSGKYLTTDGSDPSWGSPSPGSAWKDVSAKPDKYVGTDLDYADLAAVYTYYNANPTVYARVHVTAPYTVAADVTIPANVTLHIHPGAIQTINSGVLLTVNGRIEAGKYQVFIDNSGNAAKGVKFTYAEMVYPEWWGADPSGAVSSHTAFQLASQSFLYGGVILCTNIYYRFTASATLAAGSCVDCINDLEPTFTNTSGVCIQASGDFPTFIINNDVKLHGLLFLSTALENAPAMVYSAAEIRRINIERCLFEGNWNAPFTACMSFPGNVHDSKIVDNKTYQTYTFLKGHTLDCIIRDNQPGGPLSGGATQVWAANTEIHTGDYIRPTKTKIGANRKDYPWMYMALDGGWTHATTEPTWPTFLDAVAIQTFTGVSASGSTFTLASGVWPDAYNDGTLYIYMNGGANNGLHLVVSASGANLVVTEALNTEVGPVTYTVCPTVLENAGADQIRWAAVPAPIGFNIDGQVQLIGNWIQGFFAGVVPSGTISGILAKNTFIQNPGYGVYALHNYGKFDQCSISGNIFDGSSNVGIDGWWSDTSTYLSFSGNVFAGWLGYGLNLPATNGYIKNGLNTYYNNTEGNENFLAADSPAEYVKKIASSVSGNIMTWDGTGGDTPADSGVALGVPVSISAGDFLLADSEAALQPVSFSDSLADTLGALGTPVTGLVKGALIGFSATDTAAALAPGTDNYVLTADDAETLGFKWAAQTTGVPTAITVANEATDTSCFPLFATAASGDLGPKSNSGLTFNSSTGVLTATGFAGPLTGNVTGDASGSSGSCTGNAATATKWGAYAAISGPSAARTMTLPDADTTLVGTTTDQTLTTKKISIASLPSTGNYQGNTITLTAGTGGVAIYDLVYISGNGTVLKAKADATGTMRCIGMAMATVSQTNPVDILLWGVVTYSTWAFTANNDLYVSEATAGLITATAPSTATNLVQKVGTAINATCIFFNPSMDVGEI